MKSFSVHLAIGVVGVLLMNIGTLTALHMYGFSGDSLFVGYLAGGVVSGAIFFWWMKKVDRFHDGPGCSDW